MEAESLAIASSKAAGGVDPEEAKRAEVYAKQQMALLASLRKVEPLGRVVIRLDDPERLRGTPEDIELEEADTLFVPETTADGECRGSGLQPHCDCLYPLPDGGGIRHHGRRHHQNCRRQGNLCN